VRARVCALRERINYRSRERTPELNGDHQALLSTIRQRSTPDEPSTRVFHPGIFVRDHPGARNAQDTLTRARNKRVPRRIRGVPSGLNSSPRIFLSLERGSRRSPWRNLAALQASARRPREKTRIRERSVDERERADADKKFRRSELRYPIERIESNAFFGFNRSINAPSKRRWRTRFGNSSRWKRAHGGHPVYVTVHRCATACEKSRVCALARSSAPA